MKLDSSHWLSVGVALGLVCYLTYFAVIYPFFVSPLRHIPRAHWSVPIPYIGSIWMLYHRYKCRNNQTTYEAHRKCGPVARLGPNELSVNCVDDGIRTIYGGGWEKHEWYPRMFASYDVINMFSTVHHAPHSQKKRTMANIYSKSYLQTSAQLKSNSHELLTARFLPLIQAHADSGEAADVHEMNNAFTMDFMSAYQFGIGHSTNFTQDVAMRKKFFHLYHSRRDYEFHGSEIPPQILRFFARIGLPLIPTNNDSANSFIESWTSKMCVAADAYLQRMSSSLSSEAEGDLHVGDEPLVYRQFKTGMEKLRVKDPNAGRDHLPHIVDPSATSQEQLKVQELHSEMLDHLGAGHETSAIALTYLYWELSKDPALQERLHQELTSGALDPALRWPPTSTTDVFPDPKAIDSLPVLHAILMETLRLHTPIPGQEPRTSPHTPAGSRLGSHTGIPGGVRVSAMPYTLHRNGDVFARPLTFDADRWLVSSGRTTEADLKEMHRWFWAFGSGGRMCIGSHLAVQEIKLIVAAVYSSFRTEIVDDDGIEELDAYTTRPVRNALWLRFVNR